MKHSKKFFLGGVFLFLFLSLPTLDAHSGTYTIEDSWVNWPGYTSNRAGDEYGTPKVDHMLVTWNDDTGFLETVDIILHGETTWQNFNSLFINSYSITSKNADWDDWDFFVHDGGTTNVNAGMGNVPGNGLYSIGSSYQYTHSSGGGVREGNPNGIDSSALTLMPKDGNWLGWQGENTLTRSFDFGSYDFDLTLDGIQGLSLADGFFIAFSPFCANDVIGGGSEPVPEPSTIILLGFGMFAFAGVARKKWVNTDAK